MLAFRSELDSGFLWHIHIHTHIHILTDSMDQPFTGDHHFTGTTDIAFLPLCFDLLPQPLFDFSAFLDVTGFKLRPFLWAQLKTGVANGCISFARHTLPAHVFPLPHQIALFRGHLHPKLSVAPEVLTGVRRHCEPALSYTLRGRLPM